MGDVVERASDIFFFSSRRRHTRLQGDWSSDVCSSDLRDPATGGLKPEFVHNTTTGGDGDRDRKSTRLNSSHLVISYAVFCLKKKKRYTIRQCLMCKIKTSTARLTLLMYTNLLRSRSSS